MRDGIDQRGVNLLDPGSVLSGSGYPGCNCGLGRGRGREICLEIDREAGVITVISIERRYARRGIARIIVREFGKRQEIYPIVLLVIAIHPKVLLDGLIHPFRLTVGLRMKRGRQLALNAEVERKRGPES